MLRPKLNRSFVRYRDRGDPDALAWVFDQTAPALHRIARQLSTGSMEPDDLVQATFLTAIRRVDQYDPERPLVPWLVGILVRLASNASRKSGATRETGVTNLTSAESAASDDVVHIVLLREEWDAVRRAVSNLPTKYREVVIRHLEHGESGNAIAEVLEREPATVRSQIHRGLALLRRALPRSFFSAAPSGALLAAGAATSSIAMNDASLAAVRTKVLAAGIEHIAPTAAGGVTISYGTFGALLMSMRTLVVVGLVVLVGVTILFFPKATDQPDTAQSKPSSDSTIQLPPNEVPTETEISPVVAAKPVTRDVVAEPPEPKHFEWQPRPGEADVRGTVVDAATGQRVEGAQVWAFMGGYRSAEPPSFAVRTDDAGRFEIKDLDPRGFRTVHVWSDAHAFTSVELEVPPERIANETGVDAGIIQLVRGATITGRVVDPEGRGVEGAELLSLTSRSTSSFLPWYSRPVGVSGVKGRFTLSRFPPSDWGESRIYAMSEHGCGALDVAIAIDQVKIDDLEIRLGPTGVLDVSVVDVDGSPIEGAVVEAAPLFPPFTYSDMSRPVYRDRPRWQQEVHGIRAMRENGIHPSFSATTDPNGMANLPRLPARAPNAPYCVRASHEGLVTAFQDLTWIDPGESATLQLALIPKLQRSLNGVVRDDAGRTAPGVEVRRYEWFQGRFSQMTSAVVTADDGTFSFDGLTPGESFHVLTAQEGMAWIPQQVQVPPDADPEPVELKMKRAAPIFGQVVDQFDVPVEGVGVTSGLDDHWMFSRTPRTGLDGRFELPDTTTGTWLLRIVMPKPREEWRLHQIETEVVAGGEEQRFVMHREAPGNVRLIVSVVERSTGAPMTASRFHVSRTDIEHQDGSFSSQPKMTRHEGRLIGEGLKPGAWSLYVQCEGYPPLRMPFEVEAGASQVDLRAEIGGYGKIEGTVRLEGVEKPLGVIINGAGLGVNKLGEPFLEYTDNLCPLDDTLRFRFDKIPPGEVTLTLWGLQEVFVVDVKPDETTTCELIARPPK